MAASLTPAQTKWIQSMSNVCNNLLQNILPWLQEGNTLFNAANTGYLATISQPALDANPSLSGLTTAQLAAAIYALTNPILTDINNNQAVLAVLAAAGGN